MTLGLKKYIIGRYYSTGAFSLLIVLSTLDHAKMPLDLDFYGLSRESQMIGKNLQALYRLILINNYRARGYGYNDRFVSGYGIMLSDQFFVRVWPPLQISHIWRIENALGG